MTPSKPLPLRINMWLCERFGHPNGQRPMIFWKYKKGKPYMDKVLCIRCNQPLLTI
jgi:hypothetical protein